MEDKNAKIVKVLSEFRDLKQLHAIVNSKVQKSIVEVIDNEGATCRSKADIAGVFA